MARAYRYARWRGGADPLAPPYDVGAAVDALGDAVLAGSSAQRALRDLLRDGTQERRGLGQLRREVRQRLRQAQRRGRMDGTLQQVTELLDRALTAERAALFPDPSDEARLAEAELDTLPRDTPGQVQALRDYGWRSAEARAAYDEIRDLLRREVVDSSFQGLKDSLQRMTPTDVGALRRMMSDLGDLVERHNRGEDTETALGEFLDQHGQFFPDRPETVQELIDSLASRQAAQRRLLNSLSPQQRAELAGLMSGTLQDMGLAAELARVQRLLEEARPDLDWEARGGTRGEQPMGLGDATGAMQELADLEELQAQLDQGYPGASLDDVDPELLSELLGRDAGTDLEALRRLEQQLQQQGWLERDAGGLRLTPKAVRRLGTTALRRVFAQLASTDRGGHDVRDAGPSGELTGASREWQFGDEQPLDVVATVRRAVLRNGPGRVRLAVEDFTVVETERRAGAAVALLVDRSNSMRINETWAPAKATALALHTLVTTRFPQDAIEVIAFGNTAQVVPARDLPELATDEEQGTNLHHALRLARRHLSRYPGAEPVVLVVTDGEPTAHLDPSGQPFFWYPPLAETITATVGEIDRCTRSGATINVFAVDDRPELLRFMADLVRRNGGRLMTPHPDRLGEYVVQDYLRARRGRRARSA